MQRQAIKAYQLFRHDPWHSSLQFKQVHPTEPIYSARVARGYRALGVRNEDGMLWFLIGSHDDYDRLVR